MEKRYELISKADLVELLADLTTKFSNLDSENASSLEIKQLKSEIRAIQQEILSRPDKSSEMDSDSRSVNSSTQIN